MRKAIKGVLNISGPQGIEKMSVTSKHQNVFENTIRCRLRACSSPSPSCPNFPSGGSRSR